MISQFLKRVPNPPFINFYRIAKWKLKGKPAPLPEALKQKAVKNYGKKYNIDVLIETGTARGLMVDANKKNFKKIVSVEFDKKLFEGAKKKFEKYDHIKIYLGDSAKLLKKMIKKFNHPCLFWLDAHSKTYTPRMKELEIIMKSKFKHVILIDDARCFLNEEINYPSMEYLEKFIKTSKYFENYKFFYKNDVIYILPNLD